MKEEPIISLKKLREIKVKIAPMIVCLECGGAKHIILDDGEVQICPTCHFLGKIEEPDNEMD